MTADNVQPAGLRQLWMEAFGDPAEVPNTFFATAFSPNRYKAIWENNRPVSALYWLTCTCQDRPFAYIYAAATSNVFRGKGYFRQLLNETHAQLRQEGYAGAVLVPGESNLFALYEKFGYRILNTVQEFSCLPGPQPVPMRAVDTLQYARARRKFLPNGGLLQEGETLEYLQTYAVFYESDDFVLAATRQNDCLLVHELLGNRHAVPGILRALNLSRGQFRAPGPGRDFAMFLPLQEDCPIPSYFGLALD